MEKSTFKVKAKQQIDEIFSKIDLLEAEKEKSKHEMKAEYMDKITKLHEQKGEQKNKLEDLENATEDKWDETKEAFVSAVRSFDEGIHKINTALN